MYYNLYRSPNGVISTNPNLQSLYLAKSSEVMARSAASKTDPRLTWLGVIYIEEPQPPQSPQFFPACAPPSSPDAVASNGETNEHIG